MKKFKFIAAMAAVAFAMAGAFAFTAHKAAPKKDLVIFHYTSNSDNITDMKNIGNWEVVEEPTGCGATGELPCSKEYSNGSGDFQTYLNGFGTAEALADAADTRRN